MQIPDILASAAPQGARQPHRLLFRYYKDRYAAMLLEHVLRPRQPLRVLRESVYGRLLDRPQVKTLAASKGDGCLDRDDLLMLWPADVDTYVLTFGFWGSSRSCERRWNQTSRARRQLVLQLNFPRQHDDEYRRLIFNAQDKPFACGFHPINQRGRNTMAWARIDIDIWSGEALIEEVQNDWIRNVGDELANAVCGYGKFREAAACENLKIYAETVLARHAAMWSEATLSAALYVLIELLGISRIWFHSFETGCEIKQLWRSKPPRSLYTDLPRRFCFATTADVPDFILPAQPRWLRRKLEQREGKFWRYDCLPDKSFARLSNRI